MASRKSDHFVFRKNQNIGAAAAEDDAQYLGSCFIDTGDLGILRDFKDPRSIIVGRVGAGKSALISKLCEHDRVIAISPLNLSLQHIENSQILRFFSAANVNLTLFFKTLWRYVFVVEILKARHNITDQSSLSKWIEYILQLFNSSEQKETRRQIDRLLDEGGSFWKPTDERIKEVTRKIESNLEASVGASVRDLIHAGAAGYNKLTIEEKSNIHQRGQEVVNRPKLRELNDVYKLLQKDLATEKQGFLILIDHLDEDWVDDEFRYKLISSLIDESRDFNKNPGVKIIACIRQDLIQRVYRHSRGSGYQEEKIDSILLPLQWTKSELVDLLERRINMLMKHQYSTRILKCHEILPTVQQNKSTTSGIDYLLRRTAYRPRDVIEFFNKCILKADGRTQITWQTLSEAEGEYSRSRLRSLADEWYVDEPMLLEFAEIFKKKPPVFKLEQISDGALDEVILTVLDKIATGTGHGVGQLSKKAQQLYDGSLTYDSMRIGLAELFYQVGFLGLKIESFDEFNFATSGSKSMALPQNLLVHSGM